jgi:isoleucyl-tRNA synthetase
VPGWDCHGLPIELQVEKTHGKDIPPAKFREFCRAYAAEQIERQKKDFIRLGVLGDWGNPYLTMDFKTEADIMRALGKIYENGYLYQGSKPVYWCVDCGSALAEAEVEYEDKNSPAIDVKFEVADRKDFWDKVTNTVIVEGKRKPLSLRRGDESKPVYFVIWTTTPWTLPANQAVCLNPGFFYSVIETDDEYIVLAEDLYESALKRYGKTPIGSGDSSPLGSSLKGILLKHPFDERTVPVILGDHVTSDAGTGAVHTAPAHGNDDWLVMRKECPLETPLILVGGDGKFFNSDLVELKAIRGLSIWDANKEIINTLKASDILFAEHRIDHSYPCCWRHKTKLISLATHQWFIGMGHTGMGRVVIGKRSLRELALEAVEDTKFFPSWGKARLEAMIWNRPDWCVSRQRNWGVPMPLFVHKETGEPHSDTPKLLEKVALLVEKKGIEAWFSLDIKQFPEVDANQYKKVTNTLDVWFDSGVTHFSVLRNNKDLQFPADLYLEGSDQHRGWFQSSLLTGCAMDGRAPYNALLTHGFVVDGDGKKMSKSKGNVVAPQKVMDTYGADILRLWVASTDYSAELTISDEILKRVSESYRRIRNTLRFLLANLADFDATKDMLPVEEWLEIDRYALALTQDLQDKIRADYDSYEFHLLAQKFVSFCSEDLGGFYLDILKDRLYTAGENSHARRSAQSALYHITHSSMRLMAPVLSFTANEIWQTLGLDADKTVFEDVWYVLPQHGLNKTDIKAWEDIIYVRNFSNMSIERHRERGLVGSSLQAEVDIYTAEPHFDALAKLGDDLRLVLLTSRATVHKGASSELRIEVTPSTHKKCDRCWHYRADVGADAKHPTICGRCVSNLFGDGEPRKYA